VKKGFQVVSAFFVADKLPVSASCEMLSELVAVQKKPAVAGNMEDVCKRSGRTTRGSRFCVISCAS